MEPTRKTTDNNQTVRPTLLEKIKTVTIPGTNKTVKIPEGYGLVRSGNKYRIARLSNPLENKQRRKEAGLKEMYHISGKSLRRIQKKARLAERLAETNLCTKCLFNITNCETTKLRYGTGVGGDNIVECNRYKSK